MTPLPTSREGWLIEIARALRDASEAIPFGLLVGTSFGAAELFQQEVRRLAEDQNIRVFILRMKNARHLDASTVMALESLHDYLRQTGRHLLISGSNRDVSRVLQNSGLLQQIGEENIFPAEANATMSTRKALQRAKELLPAGGAEVRIFYDDVHLPVDTPPATPPSATPPAAAS